MTRTFDRKRKLSLVLRASSSHPARNYFSLLGCKLDESLIVFVIDINISALTEPANFSLLYFFYWYHFIYSLILCPLFLSNSDSSFDRKRSKESSVNDDGSSSETCVDGMSARCPCLFRNWILLALISTIERL